MNQKQIGNQCFKNKQYKQAIKHYEQYIEQEHQDNKNALFNMSLCHSKLNHPQQSINSALQAVSIDPSYIKCYYRLAHQYQKVKGKQYDVFVNAARFQKMASDNQIDQKVQMHQLATKYRKYLTIKTSNKVNTDGFNKIFEQVEKITQDNQNEEIIEVDKYLEEWLQQWNEGTQSQEAKWCQIEYITQDIDYNFGINLAYFYLNQQQSSEQKRITAQKIKQLVQRLNNQKKLDLEAIGFQQQQKPSQSQEYTSDDSSQNLFEEKSDNNKQLQTKQLKFENGSEIQKQITKKQVNKPIQSIQQKLQEKKLKLQKIEGKNEQSLPQKQNKTQQTKKIAKQPPQKSQNIHRAQKQSTLTQQQIQSKLNDLCGQLLKSKDVFKSTYQCVLKIIQQKSINNEIKGKILALLGKKVKKFKVIMAATSQNQQLVVFDHLKKCNLEQYAVDLAPKYYKI